MFSAGGFDTPSDRPRLKYSWSFGDGAKADGMNVTHVYATEGRYTVMLEVSDPEGEKGVAQFAVDISPAKSPVPPAPAGPDFKLVGGAVGAVVAVAVVAVLVLMFQRRKKVVVAPVPPAPSGPQPGSPPI
jgi:hypothetical protein